MISIAVLYLFVSGIVIYCVLLKVYLECSRGHFGPEERLDGKVALVTGATQGIGVEVARDLLRRGCRVWLACRDEKRGSRIVQTLLDEETNRQQELKTCGAGQGVEADRVSAAPAVDDSEVRTDETPAAVRCRLLVMDLCSFRSVRRAVRELVHAEGHLDVLINNAAIIPDRTNIFTEDGFEATYQTNYLSPIYLLILLIELLRKAPAARVINVSSNLHHVGLLGSIGEDATREAQWWESPLQFYSNTKLALNMASVELAHLLQEESICVNTVHPGATRTQISFHGSTSLAVFFYFIYRLYGKTPSEAAETISFAAASKTLEKVTGHHFVDCEIGWNNWRVRDEPRRRQLLLETCCLLNVPSLYK